MDELAEFQQTLGDIESLIKMWRAGLIGEHQAIMDIKIQLEIHDAVLELHRGSGEKN
jgi:hypothetical protein